MGRIALVLIAAVVLVAPHASAKRGPLVPTQLLGFVEHGKKLSVVKLDAATLAPLSKAVPSGASDASYVARSPGRGARIAFSTDGTALRFLDRTKMRWDGRVDYRGIPTAARWTFANRLVTLAETRVVVVDPTTARTRSTRSLGGSLAASSTAGDDIVAVIAPLDGIGPTKLAVIDELGRVRMTALPQIVAGSERSSGERFEWPALAVDPSATRAAVISAQGTIVDVRLDTLAISVHAVRTLASVRKQANGSWRTARWTESGTIAFSGQDSTFDGTVERVTPAGLKLIDTRDWSIRSVDAETDNLSYDVLGDVLVAYGGNGIARYASDGTQSFRLFAGTNMRPTFAAGTYLYYGRRIATSFTIVDSFAGRVVNTVSTSRPTLLAAF